MGRAYLSFCSQVLCLLQLLLPSAVQASPGSKTTTFLKAEALYGIDSPATLADVQSIQSVLDTVTDPRRIESLSAYQIVEFGRYVFACIRKSRESLTPRLTERRCVPFNRSLPSYSLGFRGVVVRSILNSPKYYSSLNDVDAQAWLVRQAFSSWYPNLSVSSGSLLQSNSVYTSNYSSSSSGSSNPSASGTAFQPTTDLSGDSSSTSSTSSSSVKDPSKGIQKPSTTFSSYTQAYPVLTLTWSFLDPTRADKINAAKSLLTSKQSDVQSTVRDVSYNAAELYGNIISQEYAISGYLLQALSAQKLLQIYETQFDAGLLPRNQVLTQKSELEQIRFDLLLATSQRQNYVQQLLPLIGLDYSYSQLFLPQLLAFPAQWPLSEESTFRLIEKYPSLSSLASQASQMSSLAASSRKSYLPALSVLAYMTYVGTFGSSSSFPPSTPQGAWSNQFSTYAGLNLTWQLFDGFSQYQQADNYEAQSRSLLDQRADQLQSYISQSFGNIALLNHSFDTFVALESSYKAGVEALSSELRRSHSGFSDPVAVIEAEQSLGQAISSYSSYYDQIFDALMSLLKLTGLSLNDLFAS